MLRTRRKFASNIDTITDGVLSVAPKYKISSGFAFNGKNVLLTRAKVLTESGIYTLWKRREELRAREENWAGIMGGKYSTFVALSLSNSDLPIVFLVYTYCLCFSLFCLAMELGWVFRSFQQWSKLNLNLRR